ncbi:hypothetical protein, partial [Staphylococcus epidermidis]|uniref:hypothetical protein n=1 Tax=Staphylococcus epidermidis TaxID=1282 RepID=UPI0037D9E59E
MENIKDGVNNLEGNEKLAECKQEGNNELNGLDELREEEKKDFKGLINNADSRDEVNKEVE